VAGRDALIVGAVSAVGGALACFAGASPTEHRSIDVLLVLLFAGLTIFTASSAPWWTAVVAAAIGTAIAPSWWVLALGLVTLAGALAVGDRRRSSPIARAVVAAGAVNVLVRLGDRWFFGATAIVGIGLCVALLVWGLVRRPRRQRRVVIALLGASAVVVIVGVIGLAVAAASSRSHLERADDAAREAIDQLADGEFDLAREGFAEANARFAAASDELSSTWAGVAGVVPVAAQYQSLGADLTQQAAEITKAITDALGQIDVDAMGLDGGRIDVDAVERARQPLHDLLDQLDQLDAVLDDVDSPWLVDRVRDEFDDLRVQIAEQRDRGQRLVDVVDRAPALLGADRPRRYFIAFTTPAEARALGGFMGNWAEITVTDGRIEMTDFGRTTTLEDRNDAPSTTFTGLDEFMARYGRYGFEPSAQNGVEDNIWHGVTLSPHWPHDAQLIAQLYEQSGGQPLDGVFAMDVDALVALLQFTGAVELTGVDEPLTTDNARQYLLVDQYLDEDNEGRIDRLEELALEVVTRLLATPLPSPPDLADVFAPLVSQQRIVAWAADPDEQALFEQLDMDGAMPDREGGDGLMVAVTNAGASKIDVFLDVEVGYDVVLDPSTGTFTAELTVELDNGAPATGLPRYVIGNEVGLPSGSSKIWLSLYLGELISDATLDGEQFGIDTTTEAGYDVASNFLVVGPSERSTVVAHLAGTYDPAVGYSLVVRNQAAVRPFVTTVTIREGADGAAVTTAITEAGVTRVTGP